MTSGTLVPPGMQGNSSNTRSVSAVQSEIGNSNFEIFQIRNWKFANPKFSQVHLDILLSASQFIAIHNTRSPTRRSEIRMEG
jgi:hypothetical protein